MKTVLVLGAGIKGSAVAALASLCGFAVTLVEREAVGAGTTSTNHGRLHLGTAGWWRESATLIERRRRASELMRRLPSVATGAHALYCFEDAADRDTFLAFADTSSIPVESSEASAPDHPWVDPHRYANVVGVPEFAFDPARLAGRFAQTCIDHGGSVLTGAAAIACDRRSDGLVVRLDNGNELPADIVVNTMTRWCSLLEVPGDAPRLNIEWWRWRFLCLPSAVIDPCDQLNGVVVIMDRDRRVPSAIPHGSWVTLDYKDTVLTRALSPEAIDSDWRLCNLADDEDRAYVSVLSSTFPPLRSLERLTMGRHLYTLAGIHPREIDVPPGSTGQVLSSRTQPGYLLAFGGQASTAFLDATEVVDAMTVYATGRLPDDLVATMVEALSSEPIDGYRPMMWNRRPHEGLEAI